jgi:uncharacterized protein with PQ loop repeat
MFFTQNMKHAAIETGGKITVTFIYIYTYGILLLIFIIHKYGNLNLPVPQGQWPYFNLGLVVLLNIGQLTYIHALLQ